MKLTRAKERFREQQAVDISPLIDMVFILLIFFVVSAVFVQERGLAAQTPSGESGREESASIELRVTREHGIVCNGEPVSLEGLPVAVRRAAGAKETATRLILHPDAPARLAVAVLDVCEAERVGPVHLSSEPSA